MNNQIRRVDLWRATAVVLATVMLAASIASSVFAADEGEISQVLHEVPAFLQNAKSHLILEELDAGGIREMLSDFVDPDAVPADVEGSIADTVWVGDDAVGVCTFRFHADGTLTYSYGGNSYDDGFWKQTGSKVYFEVNKKYRESNLVIDGDSMSGEGFNVADDKWNVTLYRVVEIPKKKPE